MKNPAKALLAILALTAQAATPCLAAPLTRGRQLERLDVLVGEWTMSGKSRGMSQDGQPSMVQHAGTMSFEWTLEGTWLLMRVSETIGQHAFHHVAMITWDTEQARYIRRVFTSTSTRDPIEEGRWVDDATLEFIGTFPWDDGHTYGFRNTFHFVSSTEIAMTLFQKEDAGEEFLRHEVTLRKTGGA